MLIHFAYAKYKADPNQHIECAIKNIFSKRKLLFSKNPEFIPLINRQYLPKFRGDKIVPIHLHSAKKGPNYIEINVMNNENISENLFSYLREDIRMICFTDISLKDIATSIHVKQYGKLGIIFHKKFLKRHGIRKVVYFEENKLIYDEKVCQWNNQYAYEPTKNLNTKERLKKRELEIEILAYRKPDKMFKSFKELRRLNLSKGIVEDVYNRYEIGYDFQAENEWRIVSKQDNYLLFSESDLSIVLVPNTDIQKNLTHFFKTNWSNKPDVRVCH